MSKRITLYAAFTADGEPVINVWNWNRQALETNLYDRRMNGDAFPGEHLVQITVEMYDRIMEKKLGSAWQPIGPKCR